MENIKSACKDNKFKAIKLPDGSYSISDIQDYIKFIIKKHETLTENPSVQIYQKQDLF